MRPIQKIKCIDEFIRQISTNDDIVFKVIEGVANIVSNNVKSSLIYPNMTFPISSGSRFYIESNSQNDLKYELMLKTDNSLIARGILQNAYDNDIEKLSLRDSNYVGRIHLPKSTLEHISPTSMFPNSF